MCNKSGLVLNKSVPPSKHSLQIISLVARHWLLLCRNIFQLVAEFHCSKCILQYSLPLCLFVLITKLSNCRIVKFVFCITMCLFCIPLCLPFFSVINKSLSVTNERGFVMNERGLVTNESCLVTNKSCLVNNPNGQKQPQRPKD